MKSPNNGGDRATVVFLLLQNDASCNRNGFYLIELLVKRVLWEPPTIQAVAKTIDCSLQTDDKTLLPKTTSMQLI